MPTGRPSSLTLRKQSLLFVTSALNRYEPVCFSSTLSGIFLHTLMQIWIKDVFVYLGQYGNFLWFQGSPGEGLHSSGKCLRPCCGGTCCVTTVISGSAAIHVPHISDVRLPLPGVVLLCERHQGHSVWLQALHPGGCTQDLLFSARGALVRAPSGAQA